ncbi:hypothetical protein QZH41_003737 [Actinostola sp. cb2023]|nr:hypothetical protein QZH41_003737 [Actinostola sp. cb2023]
MLKACSKNNIKLNKEKSVFRTDQVEFLGHLVTSQGLKPDPKKIEAILNMENPTDVEGIRRLIGTVTYLAKFLPRLSAVAEPIRRLTRQDTDWAWTDEQDKAMKEIKKLLTEAPILVYYDPSKETYFCEEVNGKPKLKENHQYYYQVQALDEESSKMTTFWTPSGRYRYLRMPFGITSAPEEFESKLQEKLSGLEGVEVLRDDILVVGYGDSQAEAESNHDDWG